MLINDEIKASSEILNPSYYLINLRGLNILSNLKILRELISLRYTNIEIP